MNANHWTMCRSIKSGIVTWCIVLAAILNSSCAAAPITNTEVMSLYQGGTAYGLAHPYFMAIQDGAAIAAWPIASGNGGAVGWGVACQNGACPQLPGNFITGAAMSQFFNQLAGQGWQLFSRGTAILRVPLVVPVTPELEQYLQAQPQG